MAPIKSIRVFETSDRKQFPTLALAKAHEENRKLDKRLRELTDRFSDGKFDSRQLECADAFARWLHARRLLVLPKPSAPAKPATPKKEGGSK